jgi:hypothetical protein
MKLANLTVVLVFSLLMGGLVSSFSELPKDYWWLLETTKEESAYTQTGDFYWKITFPDQVKDLDGQKITLKGYFYTYKDTSITLLTKNKQPFYGCSADPKITMIELNNAQKLAFKLGKKYTLEGVLKLNHHFEDSDSYTFPYRLTEVKIL